jgi:endonuclease/exonuclease/phosphatase family metal-dependent hydrolase
MQWNVKKTKGSDGQCNPGRIADKIAAESPDVVSLNEVNFYSGECAWSFDMANHLESLLQQRTGQEWYRQIVNVYGGTSGYGNVLLSRYAPISQGSTRLSYDRGVAQMTIVVNGRNINLFSTHMEYFNASWRPIQISEAVRWMSGYSEPRIVMGDFNMWPNTSDYYLMANPYQDAWVAAQSMGTASAYNGTGATHGDSRFDYVFHSRNSVLSLQSVRVPDPRVNGVYASDHAAVVATYRIN